MVTVEHLHQCAISNSARLGVSFLQSRDDPRLFPFQYVPGEFRTLNDTTENIQCLPALSRAAERTQRDAGPILVEVGAELGANVSQAFRNLVFGQTAGAQTQQMQG